MSIKKAKDAFKEMLNLCYGEDYPELHRELMSLERDTKAEKSILKYEASMQEIFDILPVLADDFPRDVIYRLEEIFQEYLDGE